MDYVASMFQSVDQRADEFQFFPVTSQQTIQHDQLRLIPCSEDSNVDLISRSQRGLRRRKAADRTFGVNDVNGKPNDNQEKKVIHRDIERQRRQEMTTLYRTLRLLVPSEYLKGKRSMSDHMNEAVNYIKYLQKKKLKLINKRDELKKAYNSYASSSSVPKISQDSFKESAVTVRPCLAGAEVVLSTCLHQGIQLSSLLQVIAAEGLSVVTCTSTKVNSERLMHTIVSEVNNGRRIEPSELQEKLIKNNVPII